MLKIDSPQEGHVREVDYEDLSRLTSQGWILIGVIDTQKVVEVEEPIPFPEVQVEHFKKKDNYNYRGGEHATWKKKVLVGAQRYLVRESVDATRDSIIGQLEEATHRADQEARIARNMTHEYQRSQEENRKLEAEVALLKGNLKDRLDALNTATATKRKLEEDLAKVRVAIGESRMKKILAGKDGE